MSGTGDEGRGSDELALEPHPATAGAGEPSLIAYRTCKWPPLRLAPAPVSRPWMLETRNQFAQRCLPLLIANQAGWYVLNSHPLRVTWNGGDDISSVRVECLQGLAPYPALSHFGHGILTWNIPYLFRTSPRYNLLVRGPANYPKDGIYPLEGIIETDWAVATFTMNWKITRPDFPITFEVGEPICMLVPQRRGDLERFWPKIQDIRDEPELNGSYQQWFESRGQFLRDLRVPDSEASSKSWQKDYFQGTSHQGVEVPEHQLRLRLRKFDGFSMEDVRSTRPETER